MSGPSRRYRFYLDPEGTERPPPAPEPPRPRPGHGTVYVRPLPDDTWWASWQDDRGVEDFEGTRNDTMRWALSRPAEQFLVFSAAADDYVPLEQDAQVGDPPRD